MKHILYFLAFVIIFSSCVTVAPGGYGSGGGGIARHRTCGARPAQNERSYVKYTSKSKKKKKNNKKKSKKNKKKTQAKRSKK